MKENPYSKMIEIMKRQGTSLNPPSIQIAEVIEPPPNLIVKVNDLQIDKDNILIADYLLKEYQRKITIRGERIKFRKNNPVGETEISSNHSHPLKYIDVDGVPIEIDAKAESSYIQTEDTLKKGDLLAVMPVQDRQLYIILARLKEVS